MAKETRNKKVRQLEEAPPPTSGHRSKPPEGNEGDSVHRHDNETGGTMYTVALFYLQIGYSSAE